MNQHATLSCSDLLISWNSLVVQLTFKDKLEFVTVLACVTRKVLGKEVLGHLGGVGQYYRWW